MTELESRLAPLAPYLRRAVERAARRARRLYADEVQVEHLVGALFEDEDSAASQAATHAFADPETLDQEMLSLSEGILVVGSDAALPFSPGAQRALAATRAAGLAAGADAVRCADLVRELVAVLPEELRGDLLAGGLDLGSLAPLPGVGGLRPGDPLFRGFDDSAKRALSRACKAAHRAGHGDIRPAQLLPALLAADPDLPRRAGLSSHAVQAAFAGRDEDPVPLPDDLPDADEGLLSFLSRLSPGSGSVAVLLACLDGERPELTATLARHKLGRELLERAGGAFLDPD